VEAYRGVSVLQLRKGDLHRAIPALERGLGLCQDWDILLLSSWFAAALVYVYALAGRSADALPLLERDWRGHMQSGFPRADRILFVSEAYLLAGHLPEAYTYAVQALEASHARQAQGNQAWALRLLGEIAAHRDPPEVEPAEACYREALALARELAMRPLEAHCHLGLGTLFTKMSQRAQARAELTAAIELYRAMDMLFWLPQAEAALAGVEVDPSRLAGHPGSGYSPGG
jgi:tetratricopeptide (TPR) repeat protein